jgi:hypothetical protein
MTHESHNKRPFQFSLSTLLLFSLAFALLMQYRQPLFKLFEALYESGFDDWSAWLVAFFAGFVVGSLIARVIAPRPVRNVVIALSWIFLIVASVSTCYLLWSRHRWLNINSHFASNNLRPLPFPDFLLLGYHDWLDARRPAPPGSIKIHGEFYTVLLTLDLLVIAFFGLLGALLGIVAPGLPRWAGRKIIAGIGIIKSRLAEVFQRPVNKRRT